MKTINKGRLLYGVLVAAGCLLSTRGFSQATAPVRVSVDPFSTISIVDSQVNLGDVHPTNPGATRVKSARDTYALVQSNQNCTLVSPANLTLTRSPSDGSNDLSTSVDVNLQSGVSNPVYDLNTNTWSLSLAAGSYQGTSIKVHVTMDQMITMANHAGTYHGTLVLTLTIP